MTKNKNAVLALGIVSAALMLGLTAPLFASAASPVSINLGSAGNFAILSKAGITDVPSSYITGNIGASPITGAAIGVTCKEVSGKIYTVNAAGPSCRVINATLLTTAVGDMQTAYTNAAGRAPTSVATTNVGAGTLINRTLTPGVYQWGTAVNIPTNLTLKGNSTDIWIFKVAGTLTMAASKSIILKGGAQAKNIFWQVSGAVTLNAGSHFVGTILAKTNIAMITGATLNGRALAQTAVTLQKNTVTIPALK